VPSEDEAQFYLQNKKAAGFAAGGFPGQQRAGAAEAN
jgi:hypothetical protein